MPMHHRHAALAAVIAAATAHALATLVNDSVPCVSAAGQATVGVLALPAVRCPCLLHYLLASVRLGKMDALFVADGDYHAWMANNASRPLKYDRDLSRFDRNTATIMGVALGDRNVFKSGLYRLVIRTYARGVTCFNHNAVVFKSMSTACAAVEKLRVVGGTPSDAPGWLAQLWDASGRAVCGGALVAPRHILTAAHCATEISDKHTVTLGATLRRGHQRTHHKIVKVKIDPQYKRVGKTAVHDFALCQLERTPEEKPIAINRNDSHPTLGQVLSVAGFGRLHQNWHELPDRLMRGAVPIERGEACRAKFSFKDDVQICAGGVKGCDTCQGDSGGPLYVDGIRPMLFGVTSFGKGCAQGTPAVYARVSAAADWMDQVVSEARRTSIIEIVVACTVGVIVVTIIGLSVRWCAKQPPSSEEDTNVDTDVEQ